MSEKAIYKPKGKAGEYASFACNFFVGCSNNCAYCYLKKGIGKKTLGGDKPVLKKCFRNWQDAINVYFNELFGGSESNEGPNPYQVYGVDLYRARIRTPIGGDDPAISLRRFYPYRPGRPRAESGTQRREDRGPQALAQKRDQDLCVDRAGYRY